MTHGASSYRVSRSTLAVFVVAAFLVSGFFVSNAQATVSNIVVNAPTNGDFWRGIQTIDWSAEGTPGVDKVYIYYSADNFSSGELVAGPIPYDQTGGQNWNTAGLAEVSSYKIKVTDQNAPFAGSNSVGTFTIDNTAPGTTAAANIPPDSTGWYNIATGKPTITLTCTDGLSGCGHTFYRWGNTGSFTDGGIGPVVIPDTAVPEGDTTLYYYSEDNAVDNAGAHNVESAKTLNVKVDTVAPDIDSYTLDGAVSVIANPIQHPVAIHIAVDAPVHWYSLVVYNAGNPSIYRTFNPADDTAVADESWDGSLSGGILEDGTYNIKIHVEDVAGNEVNDLVVSGAVITVDVQSPVVDSVTAPVPGTIYTSDPPLAFTVHDAAPGTALICSYSIDDVARPEFPCTGSESTSISGLSEGGHEVVVTVTDAAGNSDSSNPVSFIYNGDGTLTVDDDGPADFTTIQAALGAALDGNTIFVYDGSYTLGASTLTIAKEITLRGESESGVVVNGSGIDGYGIAVSANNVTLEKFTLLGPAAGSAGGNYGIKASHISNFTMRDVTVKGSLTSEVDLNTVTTGLLEGVTANGLSNPGGVGTGGVGIALSHSSGITLQDITTLGNNWGGVGLFDTPAGETTGVTFAGTNSYSESNPVYIDAEFGFGVSNITLPGFTHSVRNDTWNARGDDFTFFQQSEASAIAYALALPTPLNSYVQTLSVSSPVTLENNFIVGNGMGIQAAVNHAGSGALVTVYAGTYDEQVVIDKNLTIQGAGDDTIIKPSSANKLTEHYTVSWLGGTKEVAGVIVADSIGTAGVTIKNLKVDGVNVTELPTSANWVAGILLNETAGTIDGVTVASVMIPTTGPRGIGMVLYASGGSDVPVEVMNSHVLNYDKNGIQVQGDKLIANIHHNTVTGQGSLPDGEEIQNGVLFIDGARGVVSSNTISGNAFLGKDSSGSNDPATDPDAEGATGVYLLGSGSGVVISDNILSGNGFGIWTAAAQGPVTIEDNTISGIVPSGDAFPTGIVVSEEDTYGSVYFPEQATTVSVTGNTLSAPLYYGLLVRDWSLGGVVPSVTAHYNLIAGSQYGAWSNVAMDAEKDYWGASSGPFHVSTNPAGAGDAVSNNVDYSPWCTNPECTEFGSNGELAELELSFAPNPAVIPAASVLTVTAVDADGIPLVNDTRQIELNGGGTTRFDGISGPALINLVDGALTTNVTETTPGIVNVIAKVLGVPFGSGQVTFNGAVPTGISVDNIEDLTGIAQTNDKYLDGWHYRFRITVNNMDEDKMFVKFDDWQHTTSSSAKVTVAGNTKLFINESGSTASIAGLTEDDIKNGLTPFVSYGLGKTYANQTPNAANLVGDLSDSAGRQVQFDVFTKLPISTVPGAYSSTYGICANVTGNPADCF